MLFIRRMQPRSVSGALNLMMVIVAVIIAACLNPWPAGAAFEAQIRQNNQTDTNSDGIRVSLDITGRLDGDLRARLLEQSRIANSKNKRYLSRSKIRSLIKADQTAFTAVLRSRGYYGSEITSRLDDAEDGLKLEIAVDPGPVYRVSEIDIALTSPDPTAPIIEQLKRQLLIHIGDPIEASAVVTTETRLAEHLPRVGYPLAVVGERKVVIDHATQNARITYAFETGPLLRFGPLAYRGTTSVKDSFLNKLVPWEQGDIYDQRQVNELRRRANRTGLFTSVRIEAEAPAQQDLPLTLNADEAFHKTLGVGASFSTSEGAGADLRWEHRNLLGAAERFSATLTVAELEQSLRLQFSKPHFLRYGQTLLANTSVESLTTDAFDSRTVSADLGLTRNLSARITLTAGAEFDITEVDGDIEDQNFRITALPIALAWDGSDDLLDPTRGGRVAVRLTPTTIRGDSDVELLKSEISGSLYVPLADNGRFVLASRLRLGSITGATTEQIPANRRFFAGGGGSIRGFRFQEVGPVDEDGIPVGGRSLATLGLEARWRLNDTIGLVPFVEGGNIYDNALPDFSGFRWGAGLGLRYYTAFGPIRLDVATPIDRAPGDAVIQIYLSLGQSF